MHNTPIEERWRLPNDLSARAEHPGVPLAMRAWPLIAVAADDPEREVVVALCDGELVRDVIVVAGWPAPPDAARLTPGDRWLLATGDVFRQ